MAKAKPPYKSNSSAIPIPSESLARANPVLAAAVAKATLGRHAVQRDNRGNRVPTPVTFAAQDKLRGRGIKNTDAKTVLSLLPDLELSAQILVSSILSPKDMSAVDLIYQAPPDIFATDLTGLLVNELKTLLDVKYDLSRLVPESLRDSLFDKGSYPVLVLPENAVDAMINQHRTVTMEALDSFFDASGNAKPLGLLANSSYGDDAAASPMVSPLKAAFESLGGLHTAKPTYNPKLRLHLNGKVEESAHVTVVDNPIALRMPSLNERLRSHRTVQSYHAHGMKSAMESINPGISDYMVEKAIYRNASGPGKIVDQVPQQYEISRRSVGDPLVMKLPNESVIPIHVPGDPKKHVGYFVALDEEGNPLRYSTNVNSITNMAKGNNNIASALTQHVGRNMLSGETFDANNRVHDQFMYAAYAEAVEKDLISRVKNSGMVASAAISNNADWYRLMLSRTLANQHTQLLYVPMDYMCYIAMMYSDDGMGESLLDRQRTLNSIRVTLLFSNLINSIRNAIGRTMVKMKIDEDDPNPQLTIERAMEEIIRSRTLAIPDGVSDPTDAMRFLQQAGYEWDIENHPGLPDTTFEFEQKSSSYPAVDTELDETLRKRSIQSFGLSPETVDNGFNQEFATSVVANNILFAKRVVVWQDIFTPQVTNLLRKLANNTEDVVRRLKEVIEEHADKIIVEVGELTHDKDATKNMDAEQSKKLRISYALQLFLNRFTVELPRPSSITAESQLTDFKSYEDLLDATLAAYINSDAFTDTTAGALNTNLPAVVAMYKAYFLRKYLAERNVMPELAELLEVDDKQVNPELIQRITEHMTTMTNASVKTLAELAKLAEAATKDLDDHGVNAGEGGSTYDGGGDSSSGGDEFGLGGGDDLSFGDEPLGDEAPEDETETPKEPAEGEEDTTTAPEPEKTEGKEEEPPAA